MSRLKLFLSPEEAQELSQLPSFRDVLSRPVRVLLPDGTQLTFYYTGDADKLRDIVTRLFENADRVLMLCERASIEMTAERLLQAALDALKLRAPDLFTKLANLANSIVYTAAGSGRAVLYYSSAYRAAVVRLSLDRDLPAEILKEAVKPWIGREHDKVRFRASGGRYILLKTGDTAYRVFAVITADSERARIGGDGAFTIRGCISTRKNTFAYVELDFTGRLVHAMRRLAPEASTREHLSLIHI